MISKLASKPWQWWTKRGLCLGSFLGLVLHTFQLMATGGNFALAGGAAFVAGIVALVVIASDFSDEAQS